MGATTGIAWTDATVNFHIGCTKVGPGCDGCYAEVFANRKFNIFFGPGEKRMRTLAGYDNPLRWQRMHDRGQTTMRQNHADVPVPRWIFCNSLSDFFDNEVPAEWRVQAWRVIRDTPALRWQIVTKRVGNVAKMLPDDWDGGRNYPHVGIIATMVNQDEYDRDAPKLFNLYRLGVRWTGISMEPRLGPIKMHTPTDWVIDGGESNQGEHRARPFDIGQSRDIQQQCAAAGVAYFRKQLGDHPIIDGGRATKFGSGGDDMTKWPGDLRVQQMPRVFDADQPYVPKNLPQQKPLPIAPDPGPTLL